MIFNLFNNLNAVDMWITGSKALTSQLCLFLSSVIFSQTNDLILIFIYNFHLSDIMAFSGLLSEADKLKSSHSELKSPKRRCMLAKSGHIFFFPHPLLGTHGNEWMHIHVEHMFANTFNHETLQQCQLWSLPVQDSSPTVQMVLCVSTHQPTISLWTWSTCSSIDGPLKKTLCKCDLHKFPIGRRESMLGNCACLFKVSQSSIISSV